MNAMAPITERRAGRSGQGRAAGASAPAAVTFTLPTPPSVNGLFRNVPGRGRVKTRGYDDWRAFALTSIRQQHVPSIAGRVLVSIGVERSDQHADIDNRVKAILDAIVEAEIIADDSLVTAFFAAWLPRINGLAHVRIAPVERTAIYFHPSPDGACGGWVLDAPQPEGEMQWP